MQITYLFDPLCGWCYGASPAIDRLSGIPGVELKLAPSGLFAGEGARPMDKQFANYAWQNDRRIARLTNQVFSEAYRDDVLGAAGSLFDSAPATLGLVAVGLTEPARERDALKALQAARYVMGRANTSLVAVAAVLREAGLTMAADRLGTPDEALLRDYRKRVGAARKLMAEFRLVGVPALVAERDGERRTLPGGALFGGIDQLIDELRAA